MNKGTLLAPTLDALVEFYVLGSLLLVLLILQPLQLRLMRYVTVWDL